MTRSSIIEATHQGEGTDDTATEKQTFDPSKYGLRRLAEMKLSEEWPETFELKPRVRERLRQQIETASHEAASGQRDKGARDGPAKPCPYR